MMSTARETGPPAMKELISRPKRQPLQRILRPSGCPNRRALLILRDAGTISYDTQLVWLKFASNPP